MEKIQGLALDGEEWFSISQAATLAGVKPVAVYKRIERGQLVPREIIGMKCVCLSDIQRLWPATVEAGT